MVDTLPDIPEKKPNYDVLATDAGVGTEPPVKPDPVETTEDPELQEKEVREAVTSEEAEAVAPPKEEEVKVSDYKQFVEGDADNLLDDKEIIGDTIDKEKIEPQEKIETKPPFKISPSVIPFQNRLAQDGFDPQSTDVITHPKEILEDPKFNFANMQTRFVVGNGRITLVDRNTGKKLKSYIYLPPLSPVEHNVALPESLIETNRDTKKILDQGGFDQEDLYEYAVQDRHYYKLTNYDTKYYKDKRFRESIIMKNYLNVRRLNNREKANLNAAKHYAQKFIKTGELRDQYLGYSLALQSYKKTGETHPDARFGDGIIELDSRDEKINAAYSFIRSSTGITAWLADAVPNLVSYPFRVLSSLPRAFKDEEEIGFIGQTWKTLSDPVGDWELAQKAHRKVYPDHGEVNSVFFGNAGELLDNTLAPIPNPFPLLHLGPDVKTGKPATTFATQMETFGEYFSIDLLMGFGIASHSGKIIKSRQNKIAEYVAELEKKRFTPIKIETQLKKKGYDPVQQKGIINKVGNWYTQFGLAVKERPGVYALDSALFAGGSAYWSGIWGESTADFGDQTIEFPWGEKRVERSDTGLELLGEFGSGAMVGLGPRFAAFSVSKIFHYIGMTAFEHNLVSKTTMKELQHMGLMPKDPIAAGKELQVYKNLGASLRNQYSDYEIKEMIKGMKWIGATLKKLDPDNVLDSSALVGVYMRSNFLRDLRARTLPENASYLFRKMTSKTKEVEDLTTLLRAEELQLTKTFTEALQNAPKTPDPEKAVRFIKNLQTQYLDSIENISLAQSKNTQKTNALIRNFHQSLDLKDRKALSETIKNVKKQLGEDFKITDETVDQFLNDAGIVKLGDQVADELIGNKILYKNGSRTDDIDQIGIDFNKVSLRPEFKRLKDVRESSYASIPGFNNLNLKVNARNFIVANETAIKNIVEPKTTMKGVDYHKLDLLLENRVKTLNKYIRKNVEEYRTNSRLSKEDFVEKLKELTTDKDLLDALNAKTAAADVDNIAVSIIKQGGLRNEIPNIEIPLKVLQDYKSGLRQTAEKVYKDNANASAILWKHHTELDENIIKKTLLENVNIEGVTDFIRVNDLIGKYAAPYSRGQLRHATKMTGDLIPKLSPESQIKLFLDKTEARGIVENLDLFNRAYPEKGALIIGKDGKPVLDKALGNLRRETALRYIQDYWTVRLKQKGLRKGIENLNKSFFESGIGQYFSIKHGKETYKGIDMYNFLKSKSKEVTEESRKATISYLSFVNKVDTAAKTKIDKFGITRQKELGELQQTVMGDVGRGTAQNASEKLLKIIGFDPNAAGGSTEGLDQLIEGIHIQAKKITDPALDVNKKLSKEQLAKKSKDYIDNQIIELQQIVLDSSVIQAHGEHFGLFKKMLNKTGLGRYASVLPDMAVDTRGLMNLFMTNEKAMVKLFGQEKAEKLVDMISLTFLLSTRGDLKHTLAFPTGLSVNSMLARGFAYWRGVVGAKFLAADVGIRMLQKSGGKFLRALATSDDAIEAVTDLLLKGKYLPPRRQRIIWRHLIQATRDAGHEDLADEGEAAYQKGVHLFDFLSEKEIKEKNLEEFATVGGDENGYSYMNNTDFIQEFATLKKGVSGKR